MNYSELDDLQLLTFLLNDDEEAFAALYERHWKRIYTMALLYLKSPEAAQDTVQDVFLKVWTNRSALQQVRDFRPFLFVTARNLLISGLRNKVFHVSLDAGNEVGEESMHPERHLSYRESVTLLHKAIEQLPPQQQKAYRLSRDNGMSYEEIAAEMGISRLTVRTHISKAIGFIRKYLTDVAAHPVMLLLVLLEIKNLSGN